MYNNNNNNNSIAYVPTDQNVTGIATKLFTGKWRSWELYLTWFSINKWFSYKTFIVWLSSKAIIL